MFGVESLTTIGSHGVGGDLLFATAGLFWATFGILLRYWRVSGTRAVAVVGALSVVVFAPLHALFVGYDGILRMGLAENLLQVVVQGILAGMLPIYLFARAVILLGAGRAATFPALVPGFSLIIGYLALGVIPSIRAADRPGDRGDRVQVCAEIMSCHNPSSPRKRGTQHLLAESVAQSTVLDCPLTRAMNGV